MTSTPKYAAPPDHGADRAIRAGRAYCAGNFEARLARRLVRGARRTRTQAIIVSFVALGWIALTTIGSFLGSNEPTLGGKIGDAIYNALTFLAPRDGYGGVGPHPPLPPLLWWGRFFGVALSMLAILWAALYRSRNIIACFLIRSRAKGHMVVLSANGFADMMARGSGEEGHCVVLIEQGVSNERTVDLGRAGIVVMPEDASLRHWLRDCRVESAGVVISWMESDSLSLSSAFAARREIDRADTEVIVRLDGPEMQRSLRSAPELLQTEEGRLRPASPTLSSVRAALAGPELVRGAIDHGLQRVHVLLHGDTPALGVVASAILQHNWSIHLGAPRVTWSVSEAAGAWHDWSEHHYCFLDHVAAVFDGEEAPHIAAVRSHSLPDVGDISAHIVDCEDDDRTMAAAFDLASRLAQQSDQPIPVQVVLRNAHAARELFQYSKTLVFAAPILIGADRSFSAFAPYREDAIGAKIHRAYARNSGGNPGATDEWRTLAETYVHANSAASDHDAVKRFDIQRAHDLGMPRDWLTERLAQCEHRRWAVERLLDGWAPAETRNNDRRLHDSLVPWRDLTQNDREKDMLAVSLALDGAIGSPVENGDGVAGAARVELSRVSG